MEEEFKLKAIDQIETQLAVSDEHYRSNVLTNLKRELTELEQLPEFGKKKGDTPFAIVGGGPSLKYTVEELKHFKVICAAGSSHDWLVQHGVHPTYCLILDPDEIACNYIKHPSPTCNYLVASCCHPRVFEILKDYPVTMWNSAGLEHELFLDHWKANGVDSKKKPILGGGCTCGLRCITMAMVLGYKNLHLFGLDSNLDVNTDEHHAYEFVDKEKEELGDVIEMRLGDPQTGRKFMVAKYMMAQLWGLKELINNFGAAFDVTVHGDSITQEFMKIRRREIKRLENERLQASK